MMMIDRYRRVTGEGAPLVTMIKKMLVGVSSLGLLLVFLSGCSYPISQAVRRQAAGNLSFSDVLARPSAYRGTVVIWGGIVVKAVGSPGRSELYMWETPLDYRGKPGAKGLSNGLFIARTSQFLDPKKYVEGRKVTLAGKIAGGKLGTYDDRPYVYPVIEIEEVHLWEEPVKWNWGKIPYYWPNQYSPHRQYREPLY